MELVGPLRDSIVRICDVPAERVRSDTPLDELGIDSLASAEILVDLEMRIGSELPIDTLRRLTEVRTVGDVAAAIEAALAVPAPRPGS
jgi:acyl carrier protein